MSTPIFNIPSNFTKKFPFLYLSAANCIPNIYTIKKFGYNPSVNSDEVMIWDGESAYTFLDSSTELYVSSTSANDTSSGTGATSVEVFGIDSDYALQNKTVSLDGTTGVSIGEFLRIFRAKVLYAGTGGVNAGDIYIGYGTITDGIPANILAVIRAGYCQTKMATYTIPAGYTGLIGEFYVNVASGKDAEVHSYIRPYGEVFQLARELSLYENSFISSNNIPFIAEEKSDIQVTASSSAEGTAISAGFDILVVKNDKEFAI